MNETLATTEIDLGDDWGVVWQTRVDVNFDGLADLVQYSNSVRSWGATLDIFPEAFLRIYIQNEDGTLSESSNTLIQNPLSPIMGVDLTVADFNRDGVLDFVLGGSGWDPVFDSEDGPPDYDQGEPDIVYLSQPSGGWSAFHPFPDNVWSHNVTVGDFDGDGHDDIFSSSVENGNNQLTSSDPDRSFLSINDREGGFSYEQEKLPASQTTPGTFFTDFSLVSYTGADGLTVYPNTTYTGSVAFDANGDGHTDLVVLSDARSKANLLFLNDGSGGFSDATGQELPEPIFGYGGYINLGDVEALEFDFVNRGTIGLEANAADIDGDGDTDLVILSTFQNNRPGEPIISYAGTGIQVLKNDGSGNFEISQEIKIAEGVNNIYLHDFEFYDVNRDGQIDIVAQGTHYDENVNLTEVFLNDAGTFTNATETYIDSSTKQFFPFHRDGELHFFTYDYDWVSEDPRDGVGNVLASFETVRSGVASGNAIAGSDEAEHIIGSDGADVIRSSGGMDVLDGRDGDDVVAYAADRSAFTLSISEARVTVEDRSHSANGIDSLRNIEMLSFGHQDWNLSLFDGVGGLSEAQLREFVEVYIAYFNRAPDAEGLFFYGTAFANGTSLESSAGTFLNSAEYQAAYPAGSSNQAFAEAVYGNVLGRLPDAQGLEFWVSVLDAGDVSRDAFILEVLKGAKAPAPAEATQAFLDQKAADVAYLENKTDVGLYFSVTKGMSNATNAVETMRLFDDGDAEDIAAAVGAIDGFYEAALDPENGEFLLGLVGVIDDPFAQ